MRTTLAIVCLSAGALAQGAADELDSKQVAAPAADIVSGRVRLPDPSELATTSRALLVPLRFERTGAEPWVMERKLDVGAAGPFALALMTPDSARLRVEARGPDGVWSALADAFAPRHVEVRTQSLSAERPGWRVDRYDVADAAAGAIELRLIAEQDFAPEGWLVARDAAARGLSAHVTTLSATSDRAIGIVAHVFDADARDAGVALPRVVTSAVLDLEDTLGTRRLPLHDDGLHGDGTAADGVFGVTLPPWTSGDVRARITVAALEDGARYERSVQLAFPVVERRLALTGDVASAVADDVRLKIELGALPLSAVAKLQVSAEVWGTDAHGEFTPVCWLSRMTLPEVRGGEWRLPLFLDGRWIDVSRTRAPFVLRGVRVQDPDTHVVYDEADWLPLRMRALPPIVGQGATVVTSAMLMGPPPAPMQQGTAVADLRPKSFARTLLLVHGYCSGGSIWPAADFTAPKQEFLDPNQNRTHDQFALLLRTAGGRKSFGTVAHSQGGCASLHLYTYYWSGLDNAIGTRLIQSVATPYQGTPLASLGGAACGVNNDMTPAGSTTWLGGIPTWARAKVWYWTTSNSGSACQFLTDLFLTNPEDGTVEQFRGQLPGANSMGHVTGWCHTTGMTNPANYTDHARNALMNTNAAR